MMYEPRSINILNSEKKMHTAVEVLVDKVIVFYFTAVLLAKDKIFQNSASSLRKSN